MTLASKWHAKDLVCVVPPQAPSASRSLVPSTSQSAILVPSLSHMSVLQSPAFQPLASVVSVPLTPVISMPVPLLTPLRCSVPMAYSVLEDLSVFQEPESP